ncbi:MAG TPA: glycosyltransferase [Anaerolineales bacterium]|nr:glycosyltransferase [Anaerolineales bacterium]
MTCVSIIVPCYNEQETIRLLLEAIYAQTYPRQDLEVIVADGMSTDRTRQEIAAFQSSHPALPVRVVENPQRIIPAGLNVAVRAAQGEYIVRLDAHSTPAPDYVARCVAALQTGAGDNVGGVWEIQPGGADWRANSIATAASHPLGVGDARYRLGGSAQAVDTVPFGAFRRSLVDRVGWFDETLLTNEDYEFNARIRRAGGTVWMDPSIRSAYRARSSYLELARQYWRYGYWKARMLRRYPETFRWRQLAGVFVLSFAVLGLLAIWFPWAGWLLALEVGVYLLGLFLAGAQVALRRREAALLVGVPLAIATMHFAWGSGFIWSMIKR